MNPIDALFQRLRSQRRKAFIPFLTAGDPDSAGTVLLARTLAESGASLLELGFPYSDPIADGAVIQASYTRALGRGQRLSDVFACARDIADAPAFVDIPRVGMVSYSIIHRQGPANFLEKAGKAGFAGAIVPDLPIEETERLSDLAQSHDFKLIQLVTPTTPRERARIIARRSTGFLYCVSVSGITGERARLPEELLGQLNWLRGETDLPLCVGFGVSTPEHVQMLRSVADGVIVGSAIVRRVEQATTRPLSDVAAEVGQLARSLVAALNPA